MIIGIGHYSRTGKDTLASLCQKELTSRGIKSKICRMSGPIKTMCHDLYKGIGLQGDEQYEGLFGTLNRQVTLEVPNKTAVEIWIHVGEALREIDPNVWVNQMAKVILENIEQNIVTIIPDIRIPTECQMVHDLDGCLVKITRPGVEPLDSVPDQALLGDEDWYDYHHVNDGSIDDLRAYANFLVWEVIGNDNV